MPKINQEEFEILKPELEEEYTHVGKSRDGKLQFLQGYVERDMKREEWSDGWSQTYMRPVNLFQFIQWEDEEPYNIAELIEEYEENLANEIINRQFESLFGESEETEVKKDIEWLKVEMHKELESWHGVEGGIDGDGINEIMLLINQLDEPIEDPLATKIEERNNKHADDKVNSPSHYTRGDIEVIDIIKQLVQGYEPFEAYLVGNTIKYLARANYKENKQQDLEKSQWHINKLLEEQNK